MEINQVIKENRKKQNLTQEDLAELLNVSRSTISSWETERSYPDLEMVLALSETFGISVDDLLKGDQTIVEEITKDTRSRKKHKWIVSGLVVVLLILLFVLFKKEFYVVGVSESDIVSATRDSEVVVITLKKSLFYKDVAYDVDVEGENGDVEIMMSRTFSPFSDVSNVVEINPAFVDLLNEKTIYVVDENLEPIYEVKN